VVVVAAVDVELAVAVVGGRIAADVEAVVLAAVDVQLVPVAADIEPVVGGRVAADVEAVVVAAFDVELAVAVVGGRIAADVEAVVVAAVDVELVPVAADIEPVVVASINVQPIAALCCIAEAVNIEPRALVPLAAAAAAAAAPDAATFTFNIEPITAVVDAATAEVRSSLRESCSSACCNCRPWLSLSLCSNSLY
jgi:hypothetical protein